MQKKSSNTIFGPPGKLCVAFSSKLKYFLQERGGEEHTPETQEVPEISEIYRFLSDYGSSEQTLESSRETDRTVHCLHVLQLPQD